MKQINFCLGFDYCCPGETYTVKPAQEVISIKQSPVLKGHPFPVPS